MVSEAEFAAGKVTLIAIDDTMTSKLQACYQVGDIFAIMDTDLIDGPVAANI